MHIYNAVLVKKREVKALKMFFDFKFAAIFDNKEFKLIKNITQVSDANETKIVKLWSQSTNDKNPR